MGALSPPGDRMLCPFCAAFQRVSTLLLFSEYVEEPNTSVLQSLPAVVMAISPNLLMERFDVSVTIYMVCSLMSEEV